MIAEVTTWADLLEQLKQLPPEKLAEPIQGVKHHPSDDHVFALCPAVVLGTVDELELRYARSSVDNCRHGDELVLFFDHNPYGKKGNAAYSMDEDGKLTPIFGDKHSALSDWTGPAQKLADMKEC